uniref:WASH complex subunit 4 N-terminal domain-containing protein n=1 Tax=Timema cristinae TaxID=61476 RepID=A0A7R9CQN0_TIMCR|nr:unnamed protein product [Timema cristinae]
MGGTDWDFDRSEDESQKVVGEIQLRMYGQFLEKYSLQLQEIKDALENNKKDFWDMSIDPASLQLASHEHTTILELINTDNKVLNKVLIVFSTLCAEVKFLVSEVKTKYFDMILFYGEGSEENIEDEVTQLSHFLPHLQELCCFVKRCEEIAAQMIHQLDALYSTSKESTQVMNARDVHFQRAVEQSFTAIKIDVGKNVLLAEELHLYLKISLNTLESKFTEQLDFESAELWIPSVTLYGNVLWYPEHFLVTHLPHMNKLIDKKAQQSSVLNQQNYLQQKSQSLQKDTQTFIIQKSLIQDKHYSEKHLDILSSLVLVEKVLHGPGTKERRLIARLALSAANQIRIFREDELSALNSILYKLDMMCDIQEKLADA